MKAVVKWYNKYSSYPLILEAGRDLTGAVFFSDLDSSKSYHAGEIITVYYDSTEEEKHYFTMLKKKNIVPKVGDLVTCRFVNFKHGFGATV